MQKEWAPYPPNPSYIVSDYGDVYDQEKQKELEPVLIDGYPCYYLRGESFNIPAYRLVLRTFVGSKPPGKVGRHLDGDRLNSFVMNLAWGTVKQNHQDAIEHGTHQCLHQSGPDNPCAKLTMDQVQDIRRRYKGPRRGITQQRLANEYGVDQGTISSIVNFKSYRE